MSVHPHGFSDFLSLCGEELSLAKGMCVKVCRTHSRQADSDSSREAAYTAGHCPWTSARLDWVQLNDTRPFACKCTPEDRPEALDDSDDSDDSDDMG